MLRLAHRLRLSYVATIAVAATLLVGAGPTTVGSAESTEVDVPNASFEDSGADGLPSEWTLDPEPRAQTAEVSTERAHEGDKSLRVADPADASIAVRSAMLPAIEEATYTASAWFFAESGDPAWFYLEFFNAAGGRIAERHEVTTAGAGWQEITVTGVAPPGTETLDLLIYGSTSRSGVSFYDNVALSAELPPEPDYDPVIGNERQLFHDLERVDTLANVGRVVHEATTSDPLIRPDEPWESDNVYLYGTAIFDEDESIYKLWYQVYNRDLGEYLILYATSQDGLSWDKPNLGLHSYEGSTANNIVLPNAHTPTVIKDHAETDPARRYKMLVHDYDTEGYAAYFSSDGLEWAPCTCNPVNDGADVANVFQDPETGEFVVTWKQPDLRPIPGRRYAFLSTSTDFETWTEPELVMAADDADQHAAQAEGHDNAQIYGMPVVPYEGTYVGFPWIYQVGGSGEPGMDGSGPVDVQLAFSDDLITWNRDDRSVVIPRGVPGSWDAGMVYTSSALVPRDDELWLYYSAWDGFHDGDPDRGASIGLARWRLDGFASLANGGDIDGTITTKPLVFSGDKLRVNAAVRSGGSLRVEVLDGEGEPIPGFTLQDSVPFAGDDVNVAIEWEGSPDLGALAGDPIRLRIHLDDGNLYAYQFVSSSCEGSIKLDDNDTGVEDFAVESGCASDVLEAARQSEDRGSFMRHVRSLAEDWRTAGMIGRRDVAVLMSAAARAGASDQD